MGSNARFRALAPTIAFHDASPVLLIVHPLHLWRSGPAGGQAGGIPSAGACACAGARCGVHLAHPDKTSTSHGRLRLHAYLQALFTARTTTPIKQMACHSARRGAGLRSSVLRKHPPAALHIKVTCFLSPSLIVHQEGAPPCIQEVFSREPRPVQAQQRLGSISRIADQAPALGRSPVPFPLGVASWRRLKIRKLQRATVDPLQANFQNGQRLWRAQSLRTVAVFCRGQAKSVQRRCTALPQNRKEREAGEPEYPDSVLFRQHPVGVLSRANWWVVSTSNL